VKRVVWEGGRDEREEGAVEAEGEREGDGRASGPVLRSRPRAVCNHRGPPRISLALHFLSSPDATILIVLAGVPDGVLRLVEHHPGERGGGAGEGFVRHDCDGIRMRLLAAVDELAFFPHVYVAVWGESLA
jgi:hypothetical protein